MIPRLGVVSVVVAAEKVSADEPLLERRREAVARVAALGRVPAVGVRVQVHDVQRDSAARVMVRRRRRRPHDGVAVVVAAADHDELEAGLGVTNDLVRFQCKSRFGQLKFA